MLRLDKVMARSGAFRLKPVDLEIAAGRCHALLGPSGAGKSTLLELIVGFRRLDSGRIFMNGNDIAHVPVEQRGIGYLPQHLALFPHLTVMENILYGIRCRRKPDPADWDKMASLTHALGLTDLKSRLPKNLSGGERQRVALARALASNPDLLILDEPFSSLNETLRRELWGLLKDLQQAYGVATLMVTHDLEEAFFFGEEVHILIDGGLHQSGPRRAVFDRPVTLEAALFLGIRNLLPARTIEKSRSGIRFDCPTLGIRLSVADGIHQEANLESGDPVMLGIRSEFVTPYLNGLEDMSGNPRVKGRVVDVTETIRGAVVSLQPHGSEMHIEAIVGLREAHRAVPGGEIEIMLPASRLFFISVITAGSGE